MEANENNNNFCALSLSGGKDSTSLLLLMLEKNMPIDAVIYADTGMEFPEMEAHIAKLTSFCSGSAASTSPPCATPTALSG